MEGVTVAIGKDSAAGLRLAGDAGTFPDKAFGALARGVVGVLGRATGASEDTVEAAPALSSVDKASFKAAYGGLASFIVECVKTDASADGLTAALAEYGVDGERAALVAKLFADNAPRLRDVHAAAGIALDRVVDVEWRLDYHVQSSGVGKVHKPLYFVKLKVAEAGGGLRDVDFTCTLQQLQDMLARLKEASTAVSKALGVDSAASGAGGRSGGGGGRGRRGSLERLRGGPGAGEKK